MSYFWKWNASFIKCLTIKMSHFWNVSFLKYLFFTVDCDAMYHWFLICWILLPWIWIKERIETDFLYHAYLRQLVAQVSLSSAYHYEYPIALRHAGNSYWEVLILFQNHFSAFLELFSPIDTLRSVIHFFYNKNDSNLIDLLLPNPNNPQLMGCLSRNVLVFICYLSSSYLFLSIFQSSWSFVTQPGTFYVW